jgi:hypothetical protein
MRWEVQSLPVLEAVLRKLGYVKVGADEWRRGRFHICVKRGRWRAAINVHIDVPKGWPPFHRSFNGGEALRRELTRIVSMCRLRTRQVLRTI